MGKFLGLALGLVIFVILWTVSPVLALLLFGSLIFVVGVAAGLSSLHEGLEDITEETDG